MFRKLAATGLLLILAAPVYAQRTTGNISGVLKDSSGAVLPGVTVSATGPNIVGAKTSVTSEVGAYRVMNLPPGEYQLSFSLSGFKTLNRKAVHVSLGQQTEENASLDVSQLQEAVDVVAESSVVDASSNELGSNYDREWVDNAPLKRFSFFDLVAAAPGSVQVGSTAPGSRAPWCTALPTTRTRSSSTGPTSPTTSSTRRSRSPTWTPSRRSRFCPWARPPSTGT